MEGSGTSQRSARACPVCGRYALSVDEPPRIDVLGVQPYSELLGMGDLHAGGPLGIVCLECGTRWADLRAFERGVAGAEPPLDEPAKTEEPTGEE
jgi:hypothetical protein